MINIKDVAGLAKPLTRLIEVISKGVGAVSAPYLVRANADAQAYAVKSVAAALAEVADKHCLPAVVKDGQIEVWQRPEDGTLRLDDLSSSSREASRIEFQERRRQANLEGVTSVAAEELAADERVAEEAPDEDWISRFFSMAQDVSSDQMRMLWGRILAGEIREPGSFSLRTLDFIRSLSKSEALLFEKMGRVALRAGSSFCIPTHNKAWLTEHREIRDRDLLELSEMGALYSGEIAYRLFANGSKGSFISKSKILLLNKQEPVEAVSLAVWKFTEIGRQVLSLVQVDPDVELLQQVGRYYVGKGALATISDIRSEGPDNTLMIENTVAVTRD